SCRLGDGAGGGLAGNGGYGYYSLSGVTSQANLAEFAVGGGNNNQIGNIGVMDMSGGTINDVGWITIARGAASTGIMNVTGGTINYTNAGGGRFYFGGFGGATNPGWYGAVSVKNSTIQCPVGAAVPLELANTTGGTGIVNLQEGSVFRAGLVRSLSATSATYLNFEGGTLQASVSTANFMNGTNSDNITGVILYNDGALSTKNTIDNNGTNVTISRV